METKQFLDLEGLKTFKGCIDTKLDGKIDKVGGTAENLTVIGKENYSALDVTGGGYICNK